MPTFANDKAALLWGATAVSNGFLCEYMPSAPDGHVKVYLYGLMYACAGAAGEDVPLDDAAKALNMDRAEVERALRYWERCRLVERVKDQPPEYRFLSVPQALLQKQQTPQDDAYEAFAQALYAAFGDRRKLHGGETVLAYEWVEQLKLPPEVVLMLIQHMISTRGVQFSFKEAQKLAADMSEQQIATSEAAEALFSRSEAAWRGARKVLTRLGKRRNPSMDEIDQYVKWTVDWSFTPKAIEAACAETVKGDPTFGYLNGILKGIRERSGGTSLTGDQVEKHISSEGDENARVREMLAAFGRTSSVVDEGMRLEYRSMLELAPHEVVVLAARTVGRSSGSKSLDNVGRLLRSWHDKGLATEADVTAYLKQVDALNDRLRKLYDIMGRDPRCNQPSRELLAKWSDAWHMPDALVDVAAELSRGVDKPMPYMDKLLQVWREAGISTPDAARENHRQFVEGAAKKRATGGDKKVNEQKYEQREYAPGQYDGLTDEQIEEMKKL